MGGSKHYLGSTWCSYPVDLAEALSSIAAAILLKELAHWTKYSEDGWVFRTHEEIKQATALTRKVQETARKHLRDREILEEEHRGMPRRLFYKVDFEAVDSLLADAPNRTPVAQNVQTDLYTSKDTDSSLEANASTAKPKTVGLEKYLTDRIYNAMREASYRLPSSEYKFHLGRAKDMIEKDGPTDAELEALPEAFVKLWTIRSKADAPTALNELRRQQAREEVLSEGNDNGPSFYEQKEKAEGRPKAVRWYEAFYPEVDPEWVVGLMREGKSHEEIVEAINA